jgi:predicted acyltransferase
MTSAIATEAPGTSDGPPAFRPAILSAIKPPTTRLMSVDALRGFDMFWILGGDELVQAIHRLCGDPVTGVLATQFDHCGWEGFHIEDLIFPLFVFIAGVSLVFSLSKTIERDGRSVAISRIIRRGLLLVLFGIVYYGGISHGWGEIRFVGVLQRIGMAYLFAGLLFCVLTPRGLMIACVSLLLGYWAVLTFVPIRDIRLDDRALHELTASTGIADPRALFDQTTAQVSGRYEPGYNLTNHIDFQFLPGRKWDHYYDPEGLLSTLPAIATCLLGVFAGLLLRARDLTDRRRLAIMTAAGVALLVLGELWGLEFPVVKKLWTSSFVLVAGGWSLLLLAAFHWMIDVRGWRSWTTPFIWIGMNAIVLYMAENLVHVHDIANRFVGGPVATLLDAHIAIGLGQVVSISTAIALILVFAWFLHRKQIFMRL